MRKFRLIAVVSVLAIVSQEAASAATISCPRTASDARVLVQGLRKVRDVPCDGGMFVPCAPSKLYAPGALRPYGMAATSVRWSEPLSGYGGQLTFDLTASKASAIAQLKAATGQTCGMFNSFSCSIGASSRSGLSVQLSFARSDVVMLICDYR